MADPILGTQSSLLTPKAPAPEAPEPDTFCPPDGDGNRIADPRTPNPLAPMPTLILVDGSNQAYRAYHAIRTDLRSPDGFPTRALFGFSRVLQSLIKQHRPDYAAVVFDVGQSFRNVLYPDYKGQRPDKPPELEQQWPEFMPLCEAFGISALAKDGFEADDIIGTLAIQAAAEGFDVRIVSSDKDFAQLVSDRIKLLDPRLGEVAGAAEGEAKWGVPPEKIVDLMSLVGDKSDNVPGVAGVGVKKAAKYITEYGSWQGVLANAAAIGGKTGEKIAAAADTIALANKLIVIKTDVSLAHTIADLKIRDPDPAVLRAALLRFGFHAMIRELSLTQPHDGAGIDRDRYRTVDTPEALAQLVADLKAAARFSFDSETTSLDPLEAALVGMSFCWDDTDAVYVPIAHDGEGNCPGALDALLPLLADPSLKKTGQNLKYDLEVLQANGHVLAGIDGDTMIADYLLQVDQKHNLDALALRYLGHTMISFKEVAKLHGSAFAKVPIPDATRYAAEDAHVVWCIEQKMEMDAELEQLYREIELPLIPVLADMELTGIGVDVDALAAISAELGERIAEMVTQIHELVGETFNINSTQQLAVILFEKRGHKPIKKTKTGYSTNSAVIEQLMESSDDELLQMILDYRGATKLKSTYVDALPTTVAADGRIHTSYHQAVAATGRLSSFDPNLQNIPIRTEEGRRIRRCFVARDGYTFLSADYSQIELRLLAHFCGTGPLVEAFRNGEDIHRRTAAEIFEVAPEAVSADQRRAAKAINFGIIYGMSAFRLSRELKISREQAQGYIDSYFERYPQVRAYMDTKISEAKRTGEVKTLYGRRRAVRGLDSRNPNERGAGERVAMNTPVQGTAADLIKIAMIRVHRRLKADFPEADLLLQVHDELVLEVPTAQLDDISAALVEEMQGVASLNVPLLVETGHGRTWDAAH